MILLLFIASNVCLYFLCFILAGLKIGVGHCYKTLCFIKQKQKLILRFLFIFCFQNTYEALKISGSTENIVRLNRCSAIFKSLRITAPDEKYTIDRQ